MVVVVVVLLLLLSLSLLVLATKGAASAATAIPQSLPHPLLLLKLLLLLAEGRVRKASLAPAVDRTPRGSSRRRCRRRRLSGLGDGTGLPNERDAVYRSCVRCAERAPRISGLSETPLVDRM